MGQYLKLEKETVWVEITTLNQILIGKFTKDKGIRFTDYFNRDNTKQGFVVIFDVEIRDLKTQELTENKKFLAVNAYYIVTATELEDRVV